MDKYTLMLLFCRILWKTQISLKRHFSKFDTFF